MVFPLFFALFLRLFPIVLAPAGFSRPFNALHCNWRPSGPVNRLYFFDNRARDTRRLLENLPADQQAPDLARAGRRWSFAEERSH
jgi:hypothetical protein